MVTTELLDAIGKASVTFQPQWRQEFSRQAGGTPRVAEIGPAIWTAKVETRKMPHAEAVDIAAIINAMSGSLGTFGLWDTRRPYPRLDPDGSILGDSAVTIAAVTATSISLQGLPAGYRISRGDKVAFNWGAPAHRALHEFNADAIADGSGVLAATAVNPPIRAGATVGASATLKKAAAEMMIVPGSYAFSPAGATTSTISFAAVQVP